jgi:hypothetical protein
MQLRVIGISLGVSGSLLSSDVEAQVNQETEILRIAYDTIEVVSLPRGPRVIATHGPLLAVPRGQEDSVARANRRLASALGLRSVTQDEVVTCRRSYDCSFNEDIAGTLSLRLVSLTSDSALVQVAIQYFIPRWPQRGNPNWRAIALYEVRLVVRDGRWFITNVSVRAES